MDKPAQDKNKMRVVHPSGQFSVDHHPVTRGTAQPHPRHEVAPFSHPWRWHFEPHARAASVPHPRYVAGQHPRLMPNH